MCYDTRYLDEKRQEKGTHPFARVKVGNFVFQCSIHVLNVVSPPSLERVVLKRTKCETRAAVDSRSLVHAHASFHPPYARRDHRATHCCQHRAIRRTTTFAICLLTCAPTHTYISIAKIVVAHYSVSIKPQNQSVYSSETSVSKSLKDDQLCTRICRLTIQDQIEYWAAMSIGSYSLQ